MLKKIYKIVKKAIVVCFLLYGFNLLSQPIDLIIPINLINVAIITILGIPALFALILIHILIF